MKTNNLLVIGGVVIVGYLLYKKFGSKSSKKKDSATSNSKDSSTSNSTDKSKKIDELIIELNKSGQSPTQDEESKANAKAFFNTLSDSDLDRWAVIAKIYNDKIITSRFASGNNDSAFFHMSTRYGMKKEEFEALHKKLLEYLMKGINTAITNKSNFMDFDGEFELNKND